MDGQTEQAGVRLLQHSNHDPVGRDATTNHIRAGGGTTTRADVVVRHYRRQPHDDDDPPLDEIQI